MTTPLRVLVVACGALARELLQVVDANGLDSVTVECLPAWYHNRPEHIVKAVKERVERAGNSFDRILVGYADCGTGGHLDQYCESQGLERLPGAHCYEFFAGHDTFAALHERELGTFYLTDYLVTHFDRLIWSGLGIADHPELFPMYFGNYKRLVYLAQTDNVELTTAAVTIAERMNLLFERRHTGYGLLEEVVVRVGRRPALSVSAA